MFFSHHVNFVMIQVSLLWLYLLSYWNSHEAKARELERWSMYTYYLSFYYHLILIGMKRNRISNSLNLLTGIIPPNLGYWQNLTYLDVSFNNLIGDIPSSIGDLKQLQILYLTANQLTGKLSQNPTVKSSFANTQSSCKHLNY